MSKLKYGCSARVCPPLPCMERVLELFAGAVEPPLSASEASALHAPAACLVKVPHHARPT